MERATRGIFDQLREESIQLHFRWLIYRQLFASSPEDIDLLNERGSSVFFLLQHLLLDNIALSFSKLTDPHEQRNNKNLSIKTLIQVLKEDSNDSLANEIQERLKMLNDQCESFRTLRNKRIAHADFSHALRVAEEPLPGISRTQIEQALESLRDILNHAELVLFDSQTAYDMLITDHGSDGTALLRRLRATQQ